MPDGERKLTKADLPEIVQRYHQGESLRSLQADTGIHRSMLYRWLLGRSDHEAIVTDCLINRVCEADEALEKAQTMRDIACASNRARFSRMDLERRRPQLYGPKQEIKQDTSITIHVHREPQVIDISPKETE